MATTEPTPEDTAKIADNFIDPVTKANREAAELARTQFVAQEGQGAPSRLTFPQLEHPPCPSLAGPL